jgi:hypothetical protein
MYQTSGQFLRCVRTKVSVEIGDPQYVCVNGDGNVVSCYLRSVWCVLALRKDGRLVQKTQDKRFTWPLYGLPAMRI